MPRTITIPIKISTIEKSIKLIERWGIIILHLLVIGSWASLIYLAIFFNGKPNPLQDHPLFSLMAGIIVFSLVGGTSILIAYYQKYPIKFPELPKIKFKSEED